MLSNFIRNFPFTYLVYYPLNASQKLLLITPIFAVALAFGLLSSKISILTGGSFAFVLAVLCYKKSDIGFYSSVTWLVVAVISLIHNHDVYRPLKEISYKERIIGEIIDIQDDSYKPRIIVEMVKTSENISYIKRIRLNISEEEYNKLNIFDIIDADVFLAPPEKALFYGAYDFAFYAKNNQLQATGRLSSLYDIKSYEGFSLTREAHILRKRINKILLRHLQLDIASPALSMITGTRFFIPETISDAWRKSGIYHLLSISGLHMTIMAGLVYFLVLMILGLFPFLIFGALRKKCTAFLTIPLCFGYVLLSGGGPPILRAYIMACVCLCAIILDKRVVTLRTACCAFLIILILKPYDLFDIGFMLSFVSVLGIIIGVNNVRMIIERTGVKSKILNFVIINICAGYAGVVLSVFIFGTHSVYGFLTNMIAIPLTSFLIMPFILLVMLIFPWDIAVYPIRVIGFGVDILNDCALWVTDLPNAIQYYQAPLLIFVIIYYFGFYCIAINQRRIIQLGFMCVVVSVVGFLVAPTKDYLKLEKQRTIYYINKNKELIALRSDINEKTRGNQFVNEQILAYFGYQKEYKIIEERCLSNKKYKTNNNFIFYCIFK